MGFVEAAAGEGSAEGRTRSLRRLKVCAILLEGGYFTMGVVSIGMDSAFEVGTQAS